MTVNTGTKYTIFGWIFLNALSKQKINSIVYFIKIILKDENFFIQRKKRNWK